MMNTKIHLGYREGIVSVVLNLLLFVLKYYAGIVSASVALIADAWHTLSDSLTSVVVILGIKLSAKKPDKEHPFGHGVGNRFLPCLLLCCWYWLDLSL